MRLTEKDNSSGRDFREYTCPGCGYSDWEDIGPALWQILSDDREESRASKADRESASAQNSQPELSKQGQPPAGSLWCRLLAWLRKGK